MDISWLAGWRRLNSHVRLISLPIGAQTERRGSGGERIMAAAAATTTCLLALLCHAPMFSSRRNGRFVGGVRGRRAGAFGSSKFGDTQRGVNSRRRCDEGQPLRRRRQRQRFSSLVRRGRMIRRSDRRGHQQAAGSTLPNGELGSRDLNSGTAKNRPPPPVNPTYTSRQTDRIIESVRQRID